MPLSWRLIIATALTISPTILASPRRNGPHSNTPPTSRHSMRVEWAPDGESSRDPALTLAGIYAKYGAPMPGDLEAAVAQKMKRDMGSIEFYIIAEIGDPKFSYPLILDTSTPDLWLVSTSATNPDTPDQEPYYPKGSLSSDLVLGSTWRIGSEDKPSMSGDVFKDSITVGDLTIDEQAIQVATHLSKEFDTLEGLSGVLGLGFSSRSSIKPVPLTSFVESAMDQLNKKIFSIGLRHECFGKLNFGFIDRQAFVGDIGYSLVSSEAGFWNFTLGGLYAGDGQGPGTEYGIADTATPLLLLPMQYSTAYYNMVQGAHKSDLYGGFVFPCNAKMADFSFQVESVKITIPGRYMNFAPVNEDFTICFGALQPSDKLGFNVIGSVAFKASFVVFDPENQIIGWAQNKPSLYSWRSRVSAA
ncbi:Aspergillopepsin-1 [Ceratocystis fimbriata CBS 114723]|uniref:Aspergillopepsin-1 n=1 Tax=Ceratocystis fimbriata CBS 114723 TaxID=1035309 RepID=A0A2C5W7M6_9PEZI|nr:Aspergillopepsin-1 [Ceratocystis fimbriata CBS 114723]